MEELAKDLLALSYEDMDDFAQRVRAVALDDNGNPNDERYIALAFIDWARDIKSNSEV